MDMNDKADNVNDRKQEVMQYLTFSLLGEVYAVSVSNVREVLEAVPITRIPGMPDYMLGVLNLRGSAIPVIDLGKKLDLAGSVSKDDKAIIILELRKGEDMTLSGALVDSVREVIDIRENEMEKASSMGLDVDNRYIRGMVQSGSEFMIVLDMERVFSDRIDAAGEEKAVSQAVN